METRRRFSIALTIRVAVPIGAILGVLSPLVSQLTGPALWSKRCQAFDDEHEADNSGEGGDGLDLVGP